MKLLVRCKSCGFIMPADHVKDKCPACGVPAKLLEPYTDPVSEPRRRILSLDLHPILVHFPQAFAFSVLVLIALIGLLPTIAGRQAYAALQALSLALPFVVAGAILAGLVDGKTRFRRVSTPLLMRKIWLGSTFFVCAAGLAALTLSPDLPSAGRLAALAVFSLAAFACSWVLGKIGSSLLEAKFPG